MAGHVSTTARMMKQLEWTYIHTAWEENMSGVVQGGNIFGGKQRGKLHEMTSYVLYCSLK